MLPKSGGAVEYIIDLIRVEGDDSIVIKKTSAEIKMVVCTLDI